MTRWYSCRNLALNALVWYVYKMSYAVSINGQYHGKCFEVTLPSTANQSGVMAQAQTDVLVNWNAQKQCEMTSTKLRLTLSNTTTVFAQGFLLFNKNDIQRKQSTMTVCAKYTINCFRGHFVVFCYDFSINIVVPISFRIGHCHFSTSMVRNCSRTLNSIG